MDFKKPSKIWVIAIISVLLVTIFIFNDSFRATITRQRAIRQKRAELEMVSREAERTQQKIADLQKNPEKYEDLVRQELGYLRPGEKEVRFLKTKKSSLRETK